MNSLRVMLAAALCQLDTTTMPCCVPTNEGLHRLQSSTADSTNRDRVRSGSIAGMVRLDGGSFWMGSDSPDTFPNDGEGPERRVTISPLYFSCCPVTNEQFAKFVKSTKYVTEAERFGSSFVFRSHLQNPDLPPAVGTPWWVQVAGATWDHPEGPSSSSMPSRRGFPVVHVSWNDARAYCEWAGVRLPTEAEWEYAARGGLVRKTYPWGDELSPGGLHMCNVWQGIFPSLDLGEDGFTGVAPARTFEPNGFGIYTMVGNTWEWCADYLHPTWHVTATSIDPVGPPFGATRVLKGGSFLCHESYCNRYRVSARIGNTPDTSTAHIGLRVVRDI